MRKLLSGLMCVAPLFAASSIFDFTLNSIDGKPAPLADYKGKVLLIVNVASRCGFTPQYAGLETLFEKYKDRDLVILGFPANNFGGQEPGTNQEIKSFCAALTTSPSPCTRSFRYKAGIRLRFTASSPTGR